MHGSPLSPTPPREGCTGLLLPPHPQSNGRGAWGSPSKFSSIRNVSWVLIRGKVTYNHLSHHQCHPIVPPNPYRILQIVRRAAKVSSHHGHCLQTDFVLRDYPSTLAQSVYELNTTLRGAQWNEVFFVDKETNTRRLNDIYLSVDILMTLYNLILHTLLSLAVT